MTRSTQSPPVGDQALIQREHWEHDQSERRSPSHPAVRALFEPRAEFIASLVADAARASVLDVGCGNGFLTVPLEARFERVVGVDYSPAMIAANPAKEKLVGDAMALPFAGKSFDVVVASHLLHHLTAEDRARSVREMARIARRAVVLYEPNRYNPLMFLFGLLQKHERMVLEFSPAHVRGLIRETGFTTCSTRIEGLTTPNLCPAWWGRVTRPLERTPLRVLGFYIRAVATCGERSAA
ncbi:Demethylrebeccamycin-D-glucose O-methyltransferase [Phycisphaerales bacterium]|nr:Demethylrebeccamycin-D-glucose O-methyltransferase [Phycisphaerales bacterium]